MLRVVETLPAGKLGHEIRIIEIDRRVELSPINQVGPFEFPIQVRKSGFIWPVLDEVFMQFPLKVMVEEFGAPVRLHDLDWKPNGVQHLI
jgi:hypothetical protein